MTMKRGYMNFQRSGRKNKMASCGLEAVNEPLEEAASQGALGWGQLTNIAGPTWRHSWSYNVVGGGQTVQLAVFNSVW